MKLFLDTCVLIAASSASHPQHISALGVMESLRDGRNQAWISQHTLAETYAILTSAPLTPRIHPGEALRIVEDNILPYVSIVPLDPPDYLAVLREMATSGWRSGRIYDALILRCAEKQPIDRICTFNFKEFHQLAPHLQAKIGPP